MKRNPDLHQLRNVDVKTAEKIAEQYPADWDMERVFRRSYRKYLSQLPEGTAENEGVQPDESDAMPAKKPIRMYVNRYATAACLVLTAGIAGIIGYGLISTSKQGMTFPVQNSDQIEIVTETTAPHTETEQAQLPETVTTVLTEKEEEPLQTTVSSMPETEVTATQTEATIIQETEPQSTEPAVVQTETVPVSETLAVTETVLTETLVYETTGLKSGSVKSGFTVSDNGDSSLLKYAYSADLAPAVYDYFAADDRFVVSEDFSESSLDGIAYRVTDTAENRSYRFFVYYRNSLVPFQFSVQGYDLTETEIGGNPAYRHDLRKQDSKWGCMITWFDGNAVCQISGYKKNADTMIEIAEVMKPAQ